MAGDKTSDLNRDFGTLVFEALVDEAMRELGGVRGQDKPCNFIKEPSETHPLKKRPDFSPDQIATDKSAREVQIEMVRRGMQQQQQQGRLASRIVDETKTTFNTNDFSRDFSEIITNAEYRVWYGTNRKPIVSNGELVGFSSDRDSLLHFGQCRVFVPKSHKIGSIGSPFWKRLLTWTNDRLTLLAIDPLSQASFWQAVTFQLRGFASAEKSALVFIHGYNVSFHDAALRAAQIGFDLSITTPMAFFSWPSRGKLDGYPADEATIEWSADAIEDFLVQFVEQSGAATVHLIAHSMGNRGLLAAINSIAQKAQKRTRIRFGQIILAAADVDADFFKNRYRAYTALASRTTLYVSTRDFAVGSSQWLHQSPRVGLVPPLFVAEGIDTVNVTNVDLTMLGHGYIAEARSVLNDIHRLLADGAEPGKRMLRAKKNQDGDPYWEFGA